MKIRPRILVVDDEPDIRLMCRVNLELEGYEVLEAPDGDAAVALVTQVVPDLVVLDVMIPGRDGWQVLEWLKGSPRTMNVPVIMLTARVQREDEMRGWRGGAAEYLSKPFNPGTLNDVVRRVLSGVEDPVAHRRLVMDKLSIV